MLSHWNQGKMLLTPSTTGAMQGLPKNWLCFILSPGVIGRRISIKAEETMKTTKLLIIRLAVCSALMMSGIAFADDSDSSIQSCLRAWGTHPFGSNPKFRTLSTSVKVFGIGQNTADNERTDAPTLVLVNPGVNVLGGTTIELLNPNGWYCFRSNVNVMGKLRIKAHCKAHLASAYDGMTVLGSDQDNKSVTVMGKTQVELVGCQ